MCCIVQVFWFELQNLLRYWILEPRHDLNIMKKAPCHCSLLGLTTNDLNKGGKQNDIIGAGEKL